MASSAPVITVQSAAMLALGGLLLAAAVALDAYAAHGANAVDSERVRTAARYAAMHGLALFALMRASGAWLGVALAIAVAGCLIFVGSLLAAVWLGWSTLAAPWGGSLMILGWLSVSVAGMHAALRAVRGTAGQA